MKTVAKLIMERTKGNFNCGLSHELWGTFTELHKYDARDSHLHERRQEQRAQMAGGGQFGDTPIIQLPDEQVPLKQIRPILKANGFKTKDAGWGNYFVMRGKTPKAAENWPKFWGMLHGEWLRVIGSG